MGLRDVVENSIKASHSEGSIELRRQMTREIPKLHRRLAVLSIDETVFLVPTIKQAVEIARLKRSGMNYMTAGAEVRVFRDGDRVLKHVIGSEWMTKDVRQKLRDKKAEEYDKLQAHLSDVVLDQEISLAAHPFRRGHEVIQTAQPFIEFSPLIETNGVDRRVTLTTPQEGALDDLSNFLDGAYQLHGAHGLLPDTNGLNNIVQTDRGLVLLDSQAIGMEDPALQALILRQLSDISEILEKAA